MASLVVGLAAVFALNVYAVLLIVLRARVYRVRLYRPMLTNVGLSLLPTVLAFVLVVGALILGGVLDRLNQPTLGPAALWTFLILSTGVWLLFFPNSIYLITELNLSHRRKGEDVPLWYDIIQTLTLALSGVANALVSLGLIQLFAIVIIADPNSDQRLPPAGSWVFAGIVLLLGSLGIYLGRYLRFNSWDVRHPTSMWRKSRTYFGTPGKLADVLGFVLTHTLLLALLYAPLVLGAYQLLLAR